VAISYPQSRVIRVSLPQDDSKLRIGLEGESGHALVGSKLIAHAKQTTTLRPPTNATLVYRHPLRSACVLGARRDGLRHMHFVLALQRILSIERCQPQGQWDCIQPQLGTDHIYIVTHASCFMPHCETLWTNRYKATLSRNPPSSVHDPNVSFPDLHSHCTRHRHRPRDHTLPRPSKLPLPSFSLEIHKGMDWSGAAETDLIQVACLLVHDILNELGIHHVFMGGYQLVLLGAPRKSRDIDVEVCVSGGRSSYQRIFRALKAREDMFVFDGAQDQNVSQTPCGYDIPRHTDSHQVRGMWKGCVGIDILIRDGKPPTEVYPVRFNDMPNKPAAIVPFMPLTNLLVEKVRCASLRFKWADVHDIAFLVSEDFGTHRQLESKGLDIVEGCRAISHATYEAACRRHPAIAGLLYRMMHIKDSACLGVHRLENSFASGSGSVRSTTGPSSTLCSVESLETTSSSSSVTSHYAGSL